MKKSTNRDSQRRKLVLQRETIVVLRLPELGAVQGGDVESITILTRTLQCNPELDS